MVEYPSLAHSFGVLGRVSPLLVERGRLVNLLDMVIRSRTAA